jgi:hypothetical protein
MASERQIAANRRNAQKSTGPRTAAGRDRARWNAYRHGLASPAMLDAASVRQIDGLARLFTGNSCNPIKRGWARIAAEAMFNLARVQHAKLTAMNRAASRSGTPDRDHEGLPNLEVLQTFEQSSASIASVLSELRTLDRYEQRYSSQRDRAIRRISSFGEKK